MSRTTDADCGGTSKAMPNGSVFFRSCAGLGSNLELVPLAVGQVRNEDFPEPGGREQPHGVDAPVPAVEVADQADAIGVGRPDGEMHAGGRADVDAVRAELLERAMVGALAEAGARRSR